VLSVLVSTDYVDTVDSATWTELTLSSWPAGSNWTFSQSTADLAPYLGQTIHIGFKYTSSNSSAATWEVKNLVIE
jgi:hypothetical protein